MLSDYIFSDVIECFLLAKCVICQLMAVHERSDRGKQRYMQIFGDQVGHRKRP